MGDATGGDEVVTGATTELDVGTTTTELDVLDVGTTTIELDVGTTTVEETEGSDVDDGSQRSTTRPQRSHVAEGAKQ